MPCTYYTPEESAAIAAREHKAEMAKARKVADEATAGLCALARAVADANRSDLIDAAGLTAWWVEHQRRDAERAAAERRKAEAAAQKQAAAEALARQKAEALSKLTPEDRAALGLK